VRPTVGVSGRRPGERDPDDKAKLLEQEREEMLDYRALATTLVTMAELRQGELATEKTMRAYRSSAAAANATTVMRGS